MVTEVFNHVLRRIAEQGIEFSKEERLFYDCLVRSIQSKRTSADRSDSEDDDSDSEEVMEEDDSDESFSAIPEMKVLFCSFWK